MTTKFRNQVPKYAEVVETERQILKFFEWNLGFPLPIHFLEMFLAQGAVFESDFPAGTAA